MLRPSEWNPDRHGHLSRARDQCYRQYRHISSSEHRARQERSSRLVDRSRGDTSVTEDELESLRELGNDLEIEKDRRFILANICAHACHSDPGVALRAIKMELDYATRAFHFKSHEAVVATSNLYEAIRVEGGEVERIDDDGSETEPQPKTRPRRGDPGNSYNA